MMTAGRIASKLGCSEVTVNYRASELKFDDTQMHKLEFVKHRFDFSSMQRAIANAKDPTIEFFPEGVYFKEPSAMADYKEEIFTLHHEDEAQSRERVAKLVQHMNKRIQEESQDGQLQICYLIVSHGL